LLGGMPRRSDHRPLGSPSHGVNARIGPMRPARNPLAVRLPRLRARART
jgi:hypothetical protein